VCLCFNIQLSHSLFYNSFITVISSVKERIKTVTEIYLYLSVLHENRYIYVLWFFLNFFAALFEYAR